MDVGNHVPVAHRDAGRRAGHAWLSACSTVWLRRRARAYNTLSTVQAALRGEFGTEKVQEEVSGYYIANEVRATAFGMAVAIEDGVWEPFQTMSPIELATQMRRWASKVQLRKLARHPRGPKKPVPKRTRHANTPHVSTARLLAEARKKAP